MRGANTPRPNVAPDSTLHGSGRPPGAHASGGHPSTAARLRRLAWIVLALVVGFVVGFGWQYTRAERLRDDAAAASRALRAARLDATLASAVIESQQGHYELARQLASAFFTGLRQRLQPRLGGAPADLAQRLLAQRDVMITTLARNDPASASALLRLRGEYLYLLSRAGLDTAGTSVAGR